MVVVNYLKYLLFLTLVLNPTISTAQQKTVQEVWDRFKQTCNQILIDPTSYIDSLTIPGSKGERIISVSPDKQVTSIYNNIGGAYDEIELHDINNKQVRDCSVIGQFYNQNMKAVVEEFRDVIGKENQITLSGGHAPQEYVEEGRKFAEKRIYLFAIDGLWPDKSLITIAHLIAGEVQLYVRYVELR